ncbi:glycoside hydrolase family 25 protein [Pseudomonas sp. dw_358]|uniref:glycoside hydrolase family 25 protein n=1 Tax=Pseudomonas sp. dw_358 TaxID=2720083 RepID=UPI001BD3EF3E|nr:glycoside hydrolase family 25 protein [Pseudomonas sp. dw_358]
MSDTVELALSGTVQTTVRVNVRQNTPATTAPVLRKLEAGVTVQVLGVVVGDNVQGNAHWYRLAGNSFVWAGGCGALNGSTPAVPSGPQARLADVPLVIDMNHNDGVGSFAQAKAAGLVGVIHKATTGQHGQDDQYAERRQQALDAGLLWGAYHWGTAADPITQVDNFLRYAEPDAHTLVALDFEATPGNQMTLDIAQRFCEEIFNRLGRRPVIYSGSTLKGYLGSTSNAFFAQHRLWLAQYGSHPTVQRSWESFWLWQYTDGDVGPPGCRAVAGILGDAKKRLDCNHFAGDAATLAAQWAL